MSTTRLLLALSAAAPCAAPAAAGDPAAALPRSTPEEQGIPAAAILDFLQAAEKSIDAPNSFMLVRHGRVVAEGWWAPYAPELPHELFSLSKSFTSTAVGLAVSDGKLSLDDPVLKFFPEEAPASPAKNLQSMRVRDLLRMCTGQRDEDLRGFPFDSKAKPDLVRVFLELPVPDKPGTHFVYNTAATYMLSAIVQKVTGETVLDYLRPRLFEPLGIENPTWQASAQGISFGGYGLFLRTEDVARFGQLYLQKGSWGGRQLIPSAWVEEATSLQIANGSDPSSDWDQGYCYQFWRCRHGFYRGDGAFGQFCVVMPRLDAVVVITSGTRNLQGVLNPVWEKLVPAFGESALPADPAADQRLAERLKGLALPTAAGDAASPAAASVAGRRYAFPANSEGIEWVALEPGGVDGGTVIAARMKGLDQRIACGHGAWVRGALATAAAGPDPIAASGAWSSGDTYSAILCRCTTPFSITYDLRFAGDQLILETETNVGFELAGRVRLVGTARP